MIDIMIIEDHGIVRAGISNLLGSINDINVTAAAETAQEALSLLETAALPDVILTDLHLNDANGLDLAEKMLQQFPESRIIILTMESDERYLARAFRAGVLGYLLKDTDFEELVYGIRKVAAGKRFICTTLIDRISQRLTSGQPYTRNLSPDIELSKRETEILHLLADGFTNAEIADRLFTSRRTVEGHRQSLLNKTGVRNSPELIKFAMLNGLLEPALN